MPAIPEAAPMPKGAKIGTGALGNSGNIVSFLEIDGRVLSGEEFEDYCKDHGMCKRCARVRTHRRTLKLFGRAKKWEPLTEILNDNVEDSENIEYLVYKGYCLQPTCYTLSQAKRLLGETGNGNGNGGRRRKSSMTGSNHDSLRGSSTEETSVISDISNKSSASRLKKALSRKRISARFKRGGKTRKATTNPETGSVVSGYDDESIASDVSGLSAMSGASNKKGKSKMRSRWSRRLSSASTGSSVSSFGSNGSISDDGSSASYSVVSTSIREAVEDGQPLPIVQHRVEQLVLYDHFVVLDLTKIELRGEDVKAIVDALDQAKSLEALILDKCKLKDSGTELISQALTSTFSNFNLKKLSMRKNFISNRGAISFFDFLNRCSTLQDLDFSENSISSRGAVSIISALNTNRSCVIESLNMAQNEIWDMDDGSFLRSTKTLKVFNVDGNFMHDEGAEQIAMAIAENKNCALERLQIGWNGISDDGAQALAKMMEANSTIQVLGLAENDIGNAGARSILSALAVNTSIREISGLYHNQIDRKFIIVAIKRLLHRYGERGQAGEIQAQADIAMRACDNEEKRKNGEKIPDAPDTTDENSIDSTGSINWAAQLYSEEDADTADGTEIRSVEQPPEEENAPRASLALEAIEHWDWGTFGIEEIEAADTNSPSLKMADVDVETPVEQELAPHYSGSMPIDRITVFRSSPLAFFNRKTSEHHAVPIYDLEYEEKALEGSTNDKDSLGSIVEFDFEIATADRFKQFFAQRENSILHLSCHGDPDHLALENGFGYMQALPFEDLRRFVAAGRQFLKVVVVSAHYSKTIGELFIRAGVPHVVCCQQDASFRDYDAITFSQSFYRALARNKPLNQAFDMAVKAVVKSPNADGSRDLSNKFALLPEKGERDPFHNVPVLFQRAVSQKEQIEDPENPPPLPEIPEYFAGREVDMYEILESLRVDDVIRVGGAPGIGKASVISAVGRYILQRPKSFMINSVFWLPPQEGIQVDPDTLYGDLCAAIKMLVEAEDDIWNDEEYTDCRDRIMVEMEGQRNILVIDGRQFSTEASGENLERFLSYLLNEANVKIILITASEASQNQNKASQSGSEETVVYVRPLSFVSTAKLFGSKSTFVSSTGRPEAYTAEEFADFLVPPSAAKLVDGAKFLSQRQDELFNLMGKGIPSDIIAAAKALDEPGFLEILRLARRPEVNVSTGGALTVEMQKWKAQKEKAILGKNYLRARDFSKFLEDLESRRSQFPSLDDLIKKERAMKRELTSALAARQYDTANGIKRKMLALKKEIMKEKSDQPTESSTSKYTAGGKLLELQQQMNNMLAMAEKMNMDKSDGDLGASKTLAEEADSATFSISQGKQECLLRVSSGSDSTFAASSGVKTLICWTNEACDLECSENGKKLSEDAGSGLANDIASLPPVDYTPWGPVKCGTGEAVIVASKSGRVYGSLPAQSVILAVSPLSPSNNDDDWDGDGNQDEDALHYLDTLMRSSYRSIFKRANGTASRSMMLPTITTKETGGTYERTLRTGLRTLVEECKHSSLEEVHVIASSTKEAIKLIQLASEMGVQLSE